MYVMYAYMCVVHVYMTYIHDAYSCMYMYVHVHVCLVVFSVHTFMMYVCTCSTHNTLLIPTIVIFST
jgi:hypothetical protein